MIELYVLASGSSGNASVVRNAAYGRSILVDCGICKRDFFARSEALGLDPAEIEAVLVTHGHTDHTSGLGVVLRGLAKQGHAPALYTHPMVRASSRALAQVADLVDQADISYQTPLQLAGMKVLPFPTSHDVDASLGFRFESEEAPDAKQGSEPQNHAGTVSRKSDALGYVTDTGYITPEAHDALRGVRILAIESNHDVRMLREGPYPYQLQQRILSDEGHLSNEQCCEEVEMLLHPGLEQIVAMHISEHNNTFGLPVRVLQGMLDAHSHQAVVQAGLPRTPILVQ